MDRTITEVPFSLGYGPRALRIHVPDSSSTHRPRAFINFIPVFLTQVGQRSDRAVKTGFIYPQANSGPANRCMLRIHASAVGEHFSCRNSIIRHLQPHRIFPPCISIDHTSLHSILAGVHSSPFSFPGHSNRRLVLADFSLMFADIRSGGVFTPNSCTFCIFPRAAVSRA